jgi:hypothetical protein
MALSENIIYAQKNLPRINSLAYFVAASVAEKKSFMRMTPELTRPRGQTKSFLKTFFFSQCPVWEKGLQMWFTILILKQLLLDTV